MKKPFMLVVLGLVVLVALVLAKGFLAKPRIVSAEITKDCKLLVTTSLGERKTAADIFDRGYGDVVGCREGLVTRVSPSGRYVAFEDVSGGVDSMTRIYSLEQDRTTTLSVTGTSVIADMEFLPDDRLALLNGYPGSDEYHLGVSDIPQLYERYDDFLLPLEDIYYFADTTVKSLDLPRRGLEYEDVEVSSGEIKVYEKGADEPAVVFVISQLFK